MIDFTIFSDCSSTLLSFSCKILINFQDEIKRNDVYFFKTAAFIFALLFYLFGVAIVSYVNRENKKKKEVDVLIEPFIYAHVVYIF